VKRVFAIAVCMFSIGGSNAWCRRLLAAVVAVSFVLGFVDCGLAALDFGSWNTATGKGTYLNGDTVTIRLGANTGFYDNTSSSNAVGGPSDQPGASQYSHFANVSPTPSWTVTIDLSDYQVSSQTVFAFANLGAGSFSGTQTASIDFLDGSSNPLSLASATFLGSFTHQWAGSTFDDPASFNLSTGIWSYARNGLGVEGASAIFFLTNLPTNATSIVFTVNNPENSPNYQLDSVFFAVGSPIEDASVPEPASLALWGLGGLGCAFAAYRRRSRS
jgi:hypothetical protein